MRRLSYIHITVYTACSTNPSFYIIPTNLTLCLMHLNISSTKPPVFFHIVSIVTEHIWPFTGLSALLRNPFERFVMFALRMLVCRTNTLFTSRHLTRPYNTSLFPAAFSHWVNKSIAKVYFLTCSMGHGTRRIKATSTRALQ